MAVKTIWTEESVVRSSETDFLERWKVSGFFSAMQQAASHHADHLGYGYREMMDRNMIWVLSRVKIRFADFPLVDERVSVQTWPKGIQQKLFFMRDFAITGQAGQALAWATTAYVLISPRARRILLPNALPAQVPDNGGLSAIDEQLEKLPAPDGLEECFTTRALYSAVDLLGHVNNTKYIEWISDCFSFEEHSAWKPSWLQINYVTEVRPGDSVTLLRGRCPGQDGLWYLTGMNANGSRAFEAVLGAEAR